MNFRRASSVDQAAKLLTVFACLWFTFCAAWGMFQIPGAGHSDSGSVGAVGFSLSIAKFHILYPSEEWFAVTPPPPSSYACHHPLGIFYVCAFFLSIFGRQDFVIHLPAVLMSIATPPLLYAIGARYRGPVVGAVAACSYVVVPIAIGFANFTNLEVLEIFGSLLFFWGHTAHQQTKSWWHLVASLAGLTLACSSDWCGYAMVAPLLGWSLLRAFVLPLRWTPRFDYRPYATWWALSTTIAVGTFVFWIALFYKADKINDWLSSGITRGGDGSPLKLVLESRKNWIDFSFTPFAITLGKIAAPVALLRLLRYRRDEEAYSLSILFGAVVEYVAFKRGADVHIFWPHQFAEYFALAMAQLAMTFGGLAEMTTRRLAPERAAATARAVGLWTTLGVGLTPVLLMAPDAVRCLSIWRRTGGRYDDKGSLIRSDIDLLFVLKNVIAPHQPKGATLDTGPAVSPYWEHGWQLQGNAHPVGDPVANQPQRNGEPFWVGRGSALGSGDQLRIAGQTHVRAYGDVWVVDQRQPLAPIEAWTVIEREPGPLEWLALGGWEPVRSLGSGPDALRTWELRVHLGQPAVAPPPADAASLDDLRIWHNAAAYAGDSARAEALREKIEGQLDRAPETGFDQGLRLMGVRFTRGVRKRLEVWFVTSARFRTDSVFRVRSTIEAPARFSLMPVDPTDREMAYPPRIPTKLWRPGFIYEIDFALNHRIGVERYWGAWTAGGPQRVDGQPETTLAVLH